jgi:hypothetical protein
MQSLLATSQPFARRLDALDADGAGQHGIERRLGQAVLSDLLGHLRGQLLVLLPLPTQRLHDLALALGVDDVDAHGVRLLEAVDPVTGLDQVVELERDAEEHGPVTVALEVAAAAGDLGLGGQKT